MRVGSAGEADRFRRILVAALLAFLVCRLFHRGLRRDLGPLPSAGPAFERVRLDPWRAGWEEWALLPGIGPAGARRLVEAFREPSSGRKTLREILLGVRGIGPATCERILPQLRRER